MQILLVDPPPAPSAWEDAAVYIDQMIPQCLHERRFQIDPDFVSILFCQALDNRIRFSCFLQPEPAAQAAGDLSCPLALIAAD